MLASKNKRKENFDKNCKICNYNVGDTILLENKSVDNKLDPLFVGPYKVKEVKDKNLVIEVNGKCKEVHKNRVKLYYN